MQKYKKESLNIKAPYYSSKIESKLREEYNLEEPVSKKVQLRLPPTKTEGMVRQLSLPFTKVKFRRLYMDEDKILK